MQKKKVKQPQSLFGKIRRVIGLILVVIILGVLGILAFGALDAYGLQNPQGLYTNRFRSTWGEHGAYVAIPPGNHGPGTLPGVVMIHEWWGLDRETIAKADLLAAQGFLVVVPDALLGRKAQTVPGAILLSLATPSLAIDQAIDGAFEYTANHPLTDPERIGIMGFCFGGREAMQFGQRDARPRALITLYGSNLETEDPGLLGANGPVLGIFGAEDRMIPLAQVDQFHQLLLDAGVDVTITIYEGVGHAFVKTSEIDQPGPAREAWLQVIEFLSLHLKQERGIPGVMALGEQDA
jgi:carboxymethylenebutenolidase